MVNNLITMVKQKSYPAPSGAGFSANKQLKLFTIYTGESDRYRQIIDRTISIYKEKKFNLGTMFVPGGHTRMNCRLFLATTLPQLFR